MSSTIPVSAMGHMALADIYNYLPLLLILCFNRSWLLLWRSDPYLSFMKGLIACFDKVVRVFHFL